MKTHVFVAALLLAVLTRLAAGSVAAAATATQLRAVAVAADDAAALISLNLSARASYRLGTAQNPTRIILTLHHARPAAGMALPPAQGILSATTAQQRANGDLRLTFFLTHAVPPQLRWENSGQSAKLVMNLHSSTRARAPAAGTPSDVPPRIVQAAHAPRDSGRDIVIAVDAGHGGEDPGATGHAGVHEKDVVLAIARSLAQRINREPGMRAILTRDRDEFLTLRERIHRARVAKADLFVSIHADSVANSAVSGSSVYVLSERGATNEAARWLAERENAADLMGGVSLADKGNTLASVLLDLSQAANLSSSMSAAQSVLGALEDVGLVRKSQVQQAAFVVLKSPDIPSMLVETAYISNPAEERRLRNPAQQAALADAVFSGLRSFFAGNPPAGTRFAAARAPHAPAVLAGNGTPES
jgi:N-acetylmuramoyl-L-alanine amidase